MFVKKQRVGGKNHIHQILDGVEQSDDDRMDGLAITPVCLRIAFSLDTKLGYIPMSVNDRGYQNEKARKETEGFAPCRCSNCMPMEANTFMENMKMLTTDNVDRMITIDINAYVSGAWIPKAQKLSRDRILHSTELASTPFRPIRYLSVDSSWFMSTRSSNNPILPITDPERLIRDANAEKHRLAHSTANLKPTNSITFPTPTPLSPMSTDTPLTGKQADTSGDHVDKTSVPAFPASTMSTEDMLRVYIQAQHTSALQAAARMERLEDAVLELSLKPELSGCVMPRGVSSSSYTCCKARFLRKNQKKLG
ncbi:hypothetical protein MJO28_011151 [Puccinia striiformis f. sp. tritici]|uniref:Uncharacterized protein n=1 Tax=Puccinia striiformis f. sp. tritici TaxID=168172 RepID=A0ACC0E399_9BASI|nr:hypothetical protein MJO28_011151 [Puccinia striiformis f. sp. tritici]